MKKLLTLLVLLGLQTSFAQEDTRIKIEEETVANRLMLYALNESDNDLDVKIIVEGTDFRQSKGKPRLIRVPAITKVHLKNLILKKGVTPKYTYTLEINDSLSRRALKKPAKRIRLKPKRPINIYITENCVDCDTLMTQLEATKWIYNAINLAERPTIKKQLGMAISNLDSITKPVFMLGGNYYPEIETIEKLLEELNKE